MMMPLLLPLILVVALCLPATAQSGALAGRVVSDRAGAPIEGTVLSVEGTSIGTVSGGDGRFRIERVPCGPQRLQVRRSGFAPVSIEVEACATEWRDFEVVLTPAPFLIEEIRVKGEGLRAENTPFTVNTVDLRLARQLRQAGNPLALVQQIPGVEVQEYHQGGLNSPFTIRGFSEGGHGADTYVSLDGLLLNDQVNGNSDVNMIIPLELAGTTIFKGPSSPLFGRFNRGGAFAFTTRKGGSYEDAQVQAGSWGMRDVQLAVGREFGAWRFNAAGQYHTADSFRDATWYDKRNLAGRVAFVPSPRAEVSLSGRFHRGEYDGAGFISAEQFRDPALRFRVDRRLPKDPTDGSTKHFAAQRIDASLALAPGVRVLAYANALQDDSDQYYTTRFGQVEYLLSRQQYATGMSVNGATRLPGADASWVLGLEYLRETPTEVFNLVEGRVLDYPIFDRDFRIGYTALFAQAEFEVSPLLRPTLGFRLDRFGGELDLRDPDDPMAPGVLPMNRFRSFSPKFGLRSSVAPGYEVRANVSAGYDIPRSDLAFRTYGALGPERLWQYELGGRATPAPWLSLDLTGFVIESNREIAQLSDDPPIWENLGRTRRTGIEAEVRVFPAEGIELRGTSNVFRGEVLESVDPDAVGQPIRYVPRHIHSLLAVYTARRGPGGHAQVRSVGRYWTGADGLDYEGYTLVNAGVSQALRAPGGRRLTAFVHLNNLLDAEYATSASREVSWSPGAPRNLAAGLGWEF